MIYMRRQNNCKGQRSWITKNKAFSRYNRTIEYIILTKTVTACIIHKLKTEKLAVRRRRERRHNLIPLAKYLFKVHRFWEREKSVSFNGMEMLYQPHF